MLDSGTVKSILENEIDNAIGYLDTETTEARSKALQYYLRDQGIALSWVGTGRLIFGLHFKDSDFDDVLERCVQAARRMREDGWWWLSADASNATIKRKVLKEVVAQMFRR